MSVWLHFTKTNDCSSLVFCCRCSRSITSILYIISYTFCLLPVSLIVHNMFHYSSLFKCRLHHSVTTYHIHIIFGKLLCIAPTPANKPSTLKFLSFLKTWPTDNSSCYEAAAQPIDLYWWFSSNAHSAYCTVWMVTGLDLLSRPTTFLTLAQNFSCINFITTTSTRQWTVSRSSCRSLSATPTASSSSLIIGHTRLSTVGDQAFPVAAARIWNSLPQHVTSAP